VEDCNVTWTTNVNKARDRGIRKKAEKRSNNEGVVQKKRRTRRKRRLSEKGTRRAPDQRGGKARPALKPEASKQASRTRLLRCGKKTPKL